MEITLIRTYLNGGTNGSIFHRNSLICHCIELPWKENKRRISCIPEGEYGLKKRYSRKFKWHLEVVGVKDRSLILIHPANNAPKELKGCLAPVTEVTGAGSGVQSRKALEKLYALIGKALDQNENVRLIITS